MPASVDIHLDGQVYRSCVLEGKSVTDIEAMIIEAVDSWKSITFMSEYGDTIMLFPGSIQRAAFRIQDWSHTSPDAGSEV